MKPPRADRFLYLSEAISDNPHPGQFLRSGPVAVEIYSDRILYSGGWTEEKTAAFVYGYEQDPKGIHSKNVTDTARIYAENTATILEVSKTKTIDTRSEEHTSELQSR